MGPATHFLLGWATANVVRLSRRDRAIVTFAGVAPDLDGFGLVVDVCTRHTDHPTHWFSDYHHVLGHNLGFGLVCFGMAFWLAEARRRTFGLAILSFLVHILADVAGGRGPDGYQWPMAFLQPFSDRLVLAWDGQWELNAWPNFAITVGLVGLGSYLAWRRGYSPLSIVSDRADAVFVGALRRRFGNPKVTA